MKLNFLEGLGGEKEGILYPLAKPGLRIRTRHWIRNHIFHTPSFFFGRDEGLDL